MKGNDRIILVIWLISLALLAYGIFPKIGLTYDSHSYLKLADGLIPNGFQQQSFGTKPPLMPIIYLLLGANVLAIAIFNLTCWIVSSFITFRIIDHLIDDKWTKRVVWAFACFSTPVILVHNFAWTEPLYLVLVNLGIYFLIGTSRKTVKLASVFLAMVMLKHLAIALIGLWLVSELVESKSVRSTFAFTPALAFFLLWQWFSYNLRGDFSRLDHTSELDLMSNLDLIGDTLLHWSIPLSLPSQINTVIAISFILACGLIWIKGQRLSKMLIAVPFSILIVITTKGDLLVGDMERYLFVAYLPFVSLLAKWVLSKELSTSLLVRIPSLLLLAYTIVRTVKNCLQWHTIS